MNSRSLFAVSAGAVMGLAGCTAPPAVQPSLMVRFAPIPGMENSTDGMAQSRLVSAPGDRTGPDFIAESTSPDFDDLFTVTLWGGEFDGQDVTFQDAPLSTGNYTFGFWDHDRDAAIKGWVQVGFAGETFVDTMQRWRDRIPEQKHWLAYDFELQGKLADADLALFKDFAKQLRAFDKLDRKLGELMAHEQQLAAKNNRERNHLLRESVVLMLPTGSAVFHPTTQPVFSPAELASVQSGQSTVMPANAGIQNARSVSKFLLVANARDAKEKLSMINDLSGSLVGCRAVLREEIDRLERRKRHLITTDHIYDHDRKFVENEMRIQQTLHAIDQLNEQVTEIRERRLALALVTGLVSPDRFFDPLDTEQRDLMDEKVVLDSQKRRYDLLLEETDEDSPRRVVLQRRRQQIIRAINDIDRYTNSLQESRLALQKLRDNSRVIHRQGDLRLLAAGTLTDDVPSRLRDAIEENSVMTVRIESSPVTGFPCVNKPGARTVSFAPPVSP